MSRFSSKCDLLDWIEIVSEPQETPFECFRRLNMKLYGEDLKPIQINKPSDLVPYYPYSDAVHHYCKNKADEHWLCPPKYGEHTEEFYKRALYAELQKVIAEEDPKYV